MLVSRNDLPRHGTGRVIIHGLEVGGVGVTMWCGPCAIESREMIMETAAFLSQHGVQILRGGAFKPRTSPFSFQGLGEKALKWLAEAGERYHMITVSEVMDSQDISLISSYVHVLQIGSRSMQNYPLLKAVGRTRSPVLLKRGMGATLEEWLLAAQYVLLEGNQDVIVCERGIRTFETWTRNTLDLTAVPLVKQVSNLPTIVDLSHSLGRTDITNQLARAAVAVGADGLMCEVHPNPAAAKSDGQQSLNFRQFEALWHNLQPILQVIEAERARETASTGVI